MPSEKAQVSVLKGARCFGKMDLLQRILADAVGGEHA